MIRRASLLALKLALGVLAWAPAARALDKIPDLNGYWMGEGLRLYIDTSRHQGNVDPAKPFDRMPFLIRNVTGPLVIFVIGPHVFVARMDDADTMEVSRDGGLQTYKLTRAREKQPTRGSGPGR